MANSEPNTYATPKSNTLDTSQEPTQSGLGIASFVLALLAIAGTTAVSVYIGVNAANGDLDPDQTTLMLIGFAVMGCLGLLLTGLVLGIVAVTQKNRRRTLGIIGLILNAAFAVTIAFLLWIGITQG